MPPVAPTPPGLFAAGRKHLVVLAHHDDELPYAGLLRAMGPDVRVLWVTNSDGLAHEDKMAPADYARLRYAESVAAMALLEIPEERLVCLGHSEYTLYDIFARMSRGELAGAVPERFRAIADEVEAEARAFAPDVIWTLAWQGGQPEHDLSHLCAVRAARLLGAERGEPLPLYELPAYELVVVPLRFKPWRRQPVHELRLDPETMARKMRMFQCYPTQERILSQFERLVGLYGRVAGLVGKRFTFEDFGRREEFAPVPPDRDYRRSSHISPRLDYPGDDYEGTPIRFGRTLAPIAAALLPRG
ncbi:MAG: PIG-L family deacetylase [Deltaproteobacteria bacterium]|nr:PIG-L family deacetylase [Deltaproteobacteria bacterium]MCB9786262.1 PIG-L family deacetylase [Deltaproteobacteria bacterium]